MGQPCATKGGELAVFSKESSRLSAQVIRLPILYQLLDCFALCKLLIEHFARERRQLRVACKSQGDQLSRREFCDPWLKIRGQQPLTAQPLLQAYDAVLHSQREEPRVEKTNQQRGGKQDGLES